MLCQPIWISPSIGTNVPKNQSHPTRHHGARSRQRQTHTDSAASAAPHSPTVIAGHCPGCG